MSPFPVRTLRTPEASSQRRWLTALAVGFVAESAIATVLILTQSQSIYGPLLLLVVACVLGWKYGRLRGTVAAVAPMIVFVVAELVRQALGGTGGADPVSTIVLGFSASLFIAFFAWIVGALRNRYKPIGTTKEPAEPPAPRGASWRS
jgi:hypothetical protein